MRNRSWLVVVDAIAGERRSAFDHSRLAAALSKVLTKEITAERLPFDEIGFDDQLTNLRFSAGGKGWECLLATFELRELGPADAANESLPMLDEPHPSQRTGEETSLRFINRMKETIQVFWLDAEGGRKAYATLNPVMIGKCRSSNRRQAINCNRNCTRFITYSRVDLPPVTELRRSKDGSRVCELERADWSALLATGWKPPERFVAKGCDDATDIFGVIFRPTNFDSQQKYPVIEQIYAGLHGSFVPKRFQPFHNLQTLAELGFIIVQIDGMGTSNRSKAFQDVSCKANCC